MIVPIVYTEAQKIFYEKYKANVDYFTEADGTHMNWLPGWTK